MASKIQMKQVTLGSNKIDMVDLKTKDGISMRVIVECGIPRLIVDHSTLAKCKQDEKCMPYIDVGGFYQD